ncbi:MAG: cytosine permease [Gammaproteobacteria bacterium]|nr:cytosine permease [Gammaproteobacteria bacterium]
MSIWTPAATWWECSSGEPARVAIESKSIDYVAHHERHGRVIDQVPFWFLGNFHFFTIAIGFVGPSLGLGWGYTALAGALGILFGTVFVAFHASQGVELGLPQMIQSRAQFGFRGVVLVLIGTLATFMGFNVADTVLTAHGLHGIFGWNEHVVALAAAVASALLAIWGHDWLHRIFRWCFALSLPLYTLLTLAIIGGFVHPTAWTPGAFGWAPFAAQFAASASYNITYAPSVSDYSRYLPHDTPPRRIIAAVFIGASSSAIWLIALGAWLANRLGASDGLVALYVAGNSLLPGFGAALALASVLALVATMGFNAYSGMLTIITGLSSLFEWPPTGRMRILAVLLLTAAALALSLAIRVGAISLVFTVLTIMLYLLVPWTAVNLADYFYVRRGRYAITHLFTPRGIYGAWSRRGLGAYAVGFAAMVPFFVLPDIYTGPAARALDGVDISWLVGLPVAAAVYLWLARSYDASHEAHAIRASDRELNITRAAPPPAC